MKFAIWLNVLGSICLFLATLGFVSWIYFKNIEIENISDEISGLNHKISFQMEVLLNYQNLDIHAAINDMGAKLLNSKDYQERLRATLYITLNILAPESYTKEKTSKLTCDQLMQERRNALAIFNKKYEQLKTDKKIKEEYKARLIRTRDEWYPMFSFLQIISIIFLSVAKIIELCLKT